MNNILAYTCKFCGATGRAKYDDELVSDLDYWALLLCCNRCGDYREKLGLFRERIYEICNSLTQCGASKTGKEREALIQLTKKLATLVCGYWRKQNTWDIDFVDQLVNSPENSYRITAFYENFIRNSGASI